MTAGFPNRVYVRIMGAGGCEGSRRRGKWGIPHADATAIYRCHTGTSGWTAGHAIGGDADGCRAGQHWPQYFDGCLPVSARGLTAADGCFRSHPRHRWLRCHHYLDQWHNRSDDHCRCGPRRQYLPLDHRHRVPRPTSGVSSTALFPMAPPHSLSRGTASPPASRAHSTIDLPPAPATQPPRLTCSC